MRTAIQMLSVICPIVSLVFIIRIACAAYSEKVLDQIRKHRVLHLIWGGFAFLGILLLNGLMNPEAWPPRFVERRGQRQQVLERIQSVGGWNVIRVGCQALVTNYSEGLVWFPRSSNAVIYPNPQTGPNRSNVSPRDYGPLPTALEALKPQEIRYYPLELLREFHDHPDVAVVRIRIFGSHSTGGHSTPYYGLEVPVGVGAESYEPRASQGGVSGNRYTSFRKVADGVFEIY